MRYFADSLTLYLKEQVYLLNTREPDIYVYDEDILNQEEPRFYSNVFPSDDKSYVVIRQIGETRKRYNRILYNFAINIDMKKTDGVPYRQFYYNVKGIRDILLKTVQKMIGDFWVIRVIDYTGATPLLTTNETYNDEINMGFEIDISTVPDEDITLVIEEE